MEELKQGDRVGPYRIQCKLEEGRGGMSVVYEATARAKYRQAGWPERFALKIAKAEYEDFLKRESDFLARLDNANVVKVYPIRHKEQHHIYLGRHPFRSDWSSYFAMEYLDGGSLEELINRKNQVDTLLAVGIARQIASALAHIHSRGLIHLDVKPKNILFRRRHWAFLRPSVPQAVLCDFGLARGPGFPPPDKKAATPNYMSPEQFQESARGAVLVDHRSDIFSLGVVLYEMITGQHPFERNPGLLMQQEPRPPSEFNQRIPKRLEDITLRCLIKKPDQRYQRASELEQDLAALSLPPDWGLLARYGVIGLVLAGGLLGGGRFWSSMAPLPGPTPTPTATFTVTTTFTPRPTVIFTVTPTDTTGVVTSTPLPTYTSTPTPPPTVTPTETPAEEGTP